VDHLARQAQPLLNSRLLFVLLPVPFTLATALEAPLEQHLHFSGAPQTSIGRSIMKAQSGTKSTGVPSKLDAAPDQAAV